MHKSDEKYQAYVKILEEELVPAMGCTEPIAIAYAGAVARKTLGNLPEQLDIKVSGNIIKNVKSVIVPNTGGMRGIAAALCAGVIAGDAEALLEVIARVTPGQNNIINLRLDITHLYYPAKNSFQKGRLKRREIFTELLLYTLTT